MRPQTGSGTARHHRGRHQRARGDERARDEVAPDDEVEEEGGDEPRAAACRASLRSAWRRWRAASAPRPSVIANLMMTPTTSAQTSVSPYSAPAMVDDTMSPTPMPVAASSSPGPKSDSFTERRLCRIGDGLGLRAQGLGSRRVQMPHVELFQSSRNCNKASVLVTNPIDSRSTDARCVAISDSDAPFASRRYTPPI